MGRRCDTAGGYRGCRRLDLVAGVAEAISEGVEVVGDQGRVPLADRPKVVLAAEVDAPACVWFAIMLRA